MPNVAPFRSFGGLSGHLIQHHVPVLPPVPLYSLACVQNSCYYSLLSAMGYECKVGHDPASLTLVEAYYKPSFQPFQTGCSSIEVLEFNFRLPTKLSCSSLIASLYILGWIFQT